VSLLNCLSGTDMLEWCTKVGIPHESIDVNFCHDPIYYNISLLSYAQKDYIKQFLTNNSIDEQVSKFIDTQHVEEIKNKNWRINSRKEVDNLRRYVISRLDSKGSTTLIDVNPKIANVVGNDET